MKLCPNCGAELKPEAKFCTACGTPVSFETTPEPTYQFQEPVREQVSEASETFKNAIKGNTNFVQRAINILLKPKQEWIVIRTEQPEAMKLIGGYALILALIPALASVIKFGILGYDFLGLTTHSFGTGFEKAITHLLSAVIGVYLLAWVIDQLGPSFGSPKNFGRSLQLAVYCFTPQWVAGFLILLTTKTGTLTFLISLYAIYLLATGIPVLKETPKEKVNGYVALTIIAMIVIGLAVTMILAAILGIIFVGRMSG